MPTDPQEALDQLVGKIIIDAAYEDELVAFKFHDGTTLEMGWWANDMHDGGGVTIEVGRETDETVRRRWRPWLSSPG
jgi:cytochrome b involved in lipid metabolism